MTGSWHGIYKLWLEPGAPARECDTHARVSPTLEERFLVYEYEWSYEGAAQYGNARLGCTDDGIFQMAWTDTWHNGNAIMFCTGPGPAPVVTGTYADDAPGGAWRWRTEFLVEEPDALQVVAYNITSAGEEMRATEATYARVPG